MVECICTVHLHSAAVVPEEVLWSNASAQFICTLQPCCPKSSCGLPVVECTLLTKKVHRMRLDPSFCEVQPARALYRGGVNNGGVYL